MKSLLGTIVLFVACATQAHADPRAEVFASFDKAQAQASYRAVSSVEVKGKTMQSTIDVQLPGSFHMKSPEAEVIVLPGGSWMYQGGQWMKLPMDMSQMVKGMTLAAIRDGANTVKDVVKLDSETVEGCMADSYSYRSQGKIMGMDAAADVQLWVCQDSGLPIRFVSVDLKGQGRTTVVYDYDAAVDIRAPN